MLTLSEIQEKDQENKREINEMFEDLVIQIETLHISDHLNRNKSISKSIIEVRKLYWGKKKNIPKILLGYGVNNSKENLNKITL